MKQPMHGIANKKGVSISVILGANQQFAKSKLGKWKRGDKPGDEDKIGASNRNPNWIYPGEKLTIPSASGSSRTSSRQLQSPPQSPGAGEVPKEDLPPAVKAAPEDPCQKAKDNLLLTVSKELTPLKNILDSFNDRRDALNRKPRKNQKTIRFLRDIEDNEIESIQSIITKLEALGIKTINPEEGKE